jgi:type III secretion protein Q
MAGLKPLDVLRRIDARAYLAGRAVQRWRADGHEAGLGFPAPERSYLRFVAGNSRGQWQGVMDAQHWLEQVLAQLRPLLRNGCCASRIAQLFAAVSRPFQPVVSELAYHSISEVELAVGTPLSEQLLPWVNTPEGQLWIVGDIPSCSAQSSHLPAWLSDFPLPVRMVVGRGRLQPGELECLAAGDVLLITERTQHLSMAERCIGLFTLAKEGFHVEFNASHLPTQVSAQRQEPATATHDMDALRDLPVELEFVLQETVYRLGELSNLQSGQVLALQAGAQTSVQVRANGQVLAVGELVQWEDGLGVELHTLVRGTRE